MLVGHDNLYFIHLEEKILEAGGFLNELVVHAAFYLTSDCFIGFILSSVPYSDIQYLSRQNWFHSQLYFLF